MFFFLKNFSAFFKLDSKVITNYFVTTICVGNVIANNARSEKHPLSIP